MEIPAIGGRTDDRSAHNFTSGFIVHTVGECMSNIVGESTNMTLGFCSNFPRKFLLVGINSEINFIPPLMEQKNTDIHGLPGQHSQWDLFIQTLDSCVVHDIADILETFQPCFRRCTLVFHQPMSEPLDMILAVFCKILMLEIGFTLPVINTISMENILHKVDDLIPTLVTNQL